MPQFQQSALVPSQLTILTTSACNARCAHCSMNSAPERDETLDAENILRVVEEVHDETPLDVVIFAGGEPTLLGDDLLEAIASVDCMGISSRIVTNGWWASTPETAREMLLTLRQSGLQELNISADDFHLPWIPLQNVCNAWHASKGMGFGAVVIALCSGPRSKLTPERMAAEIGESPHLVWDEDGVQQALGEPSADGTVYALANNRIYRIGRGQNLREGYADLPDSQADLDRQCPWAVRSPALSPNGHLVACCGIEAEGNEVLDFGDLGTQPARLLLEQANADTLVSAIAELGPRHLLTRARELNLGGGFRDAYASICEVCEDVVSRPEVVEGLRQDTRLKNEVELARLTRFLGAGPTAG